MLSLAEQIENKEKLSIEKKTVFQKLAEVFTDPGNIQFLMMDNLELSFNSQIGNPRIWQEFLQLEETQNYVQSQMRFLTDVAHRKAFAALQDKAMTGDTTAAKQINELAGVFQRGDDNKILILHQISRPQIQEEVK